MTRISRGTVPFTMAPARHAVLFCNGRHVVSGRASFVWETFLLRRAAGVPGDYAIRDNPGGRQPRPLHRIDWTVEEAEEALLAWGSLPGYGRRRLDRARRTRAARTDRGLPVG